MRRSIAVVLGFVLLALALLAGGCGGSDGTAAGPSGSSVGADKRSAAPDFEGVTLQGTEVSLDSYAGKPLVLIFWASW